MIVMTKKLQKMMDELKKTNSETYYHCVHVKSLVYKMVKLMNSEGRTNYTPKQIDAICKGAFLHDIGKLYISNAVLTKMASLDAEEMGHMTKHTSLGYEAVKEELSEDEDEIIKNILLFHHERRDGSGYEKKTDLPEYVRITAICDAFDALHSDRVYRKRMSKEKALSLIKNGECGKFSDEMYECLEKAVEDID